MDCVTSPKVAAGTDARAKAGCEAKDCRCPRSAAVPSFKSRADKSASRDSMTSPSRTGFLLSEDGGPCKLSGTKSRTSGYMVTTYPPKKKGSLLN